MADIATKYRCRLCGARIDGPPGGPDEGGDIRSALHRMTGIGPGDEVGCPRSPGPRPSPTIIHLCWPTQAGIADFAGIEIT